MSDVIIITAGGFGREVMQLVLDCLGTDKDPGMIVRGFVDDDTILKDHMINNYPVLGEIASLSAITKPTVLAVGVGNPQTREHIVNLLFQNHNLKFPPFVHPTVSISSTVNIQNGTILCRGTVPTVNIDIGRFTIVNLCCTIGHDVRIGDFCTLAPSVNISGGCRIGNHVDIGTNAILLPEIKVGNRAIIGAGAVVTKNVRENTTVVGVPAKVVREGMTRRDT